MDSRDLCVYREEGGVNSGQSCGMEQGKTQRQRTQRRDEDHKEPSLWARLHPTGRRKGRGEARTGNIIKKTSTVARGDF